MATENVEDRLAALENRLARIETQLKLRSDRTPSPNAQSPAQQLTAARELTPGKAQPDSLPPVRTQPSPPDRSSLVTNILGWGGAVAFVLAAAYLIRLGIDNGWLTPVIQVATAAVAGFLFIGAGFGLRNYYPRYAGYLPACGIVILFLAIYGAHLYYGLIGVQTAGLFVMLVCALSLWLCRAFDSDLYALFAVAGSYSAPFLLHASQASITNLVIYFSAWSVVFSLFAIWYGRRLIYLLALYLALVGFDVIRHETAPTHWIAAIAFQSVQFVIFGIAAMVFSVRRHDPMNVLTALAHLPPLLLFYALQYYVLHAHLPALAPWISVASLVAVWVLYFGARQLLQRPLPGGEWLLWCYLALVLFHAGYIETWPAEWAPWASFILVPIAVLATMQRKKGLGPLWVLWAAVGAILLLNYLRVILDFNMQQVPGHAILSIAYALLLYAGYYLISGREGLREIKMLLIYAGHISAMAAAVHLLHVRIVESTAWGLLALACLGISIWKNNRMLGQSSLLVFGATAAKVLIYDLDGAGPLVRIISLVVLGATFYVGGMLYQRLLGVRSAA